MRQFGWRPEEDARDESYTLRALAMPDVTEREWWADGWHGDQGATPECVAYALLHHLNDGPDPYTLFNVRRPGMVPRELYCDARDRDPWPKPCDAHAGTSLRAGAKALKARGFITRYEWLRTLPDITAYVLGTGALVLGTHWFEGMSRPDADGVIRIAGGLLGGHAYVLNGINVDSGFARVKNSWGRGWGMGGHAFLPLEDLERLTGLVWLGEVMAVKY